MRIVNTNSFLYCYPRLQLFTCRYKARCDYRMESAMMEKYPSLQPEFP